MHLLVNYFCVHMLGCSTSQHIKHFAEKEVQTDDLPILHGEDMQVQFIDDSVDTKTQDSKILQRT